MFTYSSATLLITPILPNLEQAFDVGPSASGAALSYYALAFALALLPFGPLADRFDKRRLLMIGLALFAFANLGCFLAPTFNWFLTFRTVTGIASAMLPPSLWGYVAEYFPFEKRGRAVGIIMSSFSLVPILGVPLGAYLAQLFGWPAIPLLLSACGILSVVFLAIFLPQVESKTVYVKGALFKGISSVVKTPHSLVALCTTLFAGAAHWGLLAFLPGFLTKVYGFSTMSNGLFLSLYGIAGIAANQVGGRLADQVGKKRLLVRAFLFYILPLMLIPIWSPHPWVTLGLMILWNMALSVALPAQITIITEIVPAARSTMMSMNTAIFNLGITMGTMLGGKVMLASGSFQSLAILCTVLALVNVMLCNQLPDDVPQTATKSA
ncbi:MAG: MFS transporter [Candidatus Sericytochromatia bacterium]|nr:MFS transporter [Candidatus Sericytochromatia bacterium]